MNDLQFCDPGIDTQINDALAEPASDPEAARGLWERIDRETVDQAPWVPLVNLRVVGVLRRGVGNYRYTAPLGLLIDSSGSSSRAARAAQAPRAIAPGPGSARMSRAVTGSPHSEQTSVGLVGLPHVRCSRRTGGPVPSGSYRSPHCIERDETG